MNKKDKLICLISVGLCVVILLGKYLYGSYTKSKEEQVADALSTIQVAMQKKIQDEIIDAAEDIKNAQNSKKHVDKQQQLVEQTKKTVITRQSNPTAFGIEIGNTTEQEIRDKFAVSEHSESKKHVDKQQQLVEQTKKTVITRQSNPTVFGIEIGNTTEQEIRDKFAVIREDGCIYNAQYKVFCLNVKDFSSEVLPVQEVEIVLNQNGVVIRLRLVYSGHQFSQLHPKLSKKYKVVFSNIPFVGDRYAEYTHNNILIQLDEPHMGKFVTYLCYITKQLEEESAAFRRKQKQENDQRIADQL